MFLNMPIGACANPASLSQSCASVSKSTCDIAHDLKRGINMGNMLEAPNEGDWGIRFDPAYVNLIKGKFDTVRVPVRWSNHAAPTADAKIDEFFIRRVERVVDDLLAKGFYVILDMHHYNQIVGEKLNPKEFEVDSAVLETRFENMWQQISERFKDKSSKLIFELLNEPHGRLNSKAWNGLAAKTLQVVRESNPTRTVMIGPTYYNNIRDLSKLVLPKDKNIIVSIHNYTPFFFTHQGINYLPMDMPTGVKCCLIDQKRQIVAELNQAVSWNKMYGFPLHLGEFGSYSKADMESRAAYTRFVRTELENRAIGWSYWEFGSSFGIYNPKKKQWREPLVNALLN